MKGIYYSVSGSLSALVATTLPGLLIVGLVEAEINRALFFYATEIGNVFQNICLTNSLTKNNF